MEENQKQSLHYKLWKIGEMCDVLVKDAAAFNYKYVKEADVLAKTKAGFQKYGVNLYTEIVPGTMTVTPYTYERYDSKLKVNKPINEFIVEAQLLYTFINVEDPTDKLEVPFTMVASMEDPSLAMGAALSYSSRYFLLKFFKIPTLDDDPEQYRSKQKEAETYEEQKEARTLEEELKKMVDEIVAKGTELIKKGFKKEDIMDAVGKHNNGNQNPSSIRTKEICAAVMEEFEAMASAAEKKTTKSTKGVTKQ